MTGVHDQEQVQDAEPDPRFTLANERTFLAWNRTALALVAAALATAQLLTGVSHLARLAIAIPLAVLAGAVSLTSHRRWRANQRALRQRAPLPESLLPTILTLGVAVVAAITAIAVLAS